MEIKIINSPYYMSEACDCCEGWWYDSYKIEVDGVYESVEHAWDGKEDITFPDLQSAEEYVKEHFPLQHFKVVDDGYPDYDEEDY